MELTKPSIRSKKILQILCSQSGYITLATIAEQMNVSSRTVLRELEEVESLLLSKGLGLDKKTRLGIKLSGSLEAKNELLNLLSGISEDKDYMPQERQVIIISELLQNQNPTKLFYFTTIFNVSEGTISHDLDKVEEWLAHQQLKLVRKPGLGIYITGSESSIRRAIVNLIYENLDENQLLHMLRANFSTVGEPPGNIEIRTRNRLLNLIDKKVINKLEVLVHEAENAMGYKFADSAYVGLIVHLALAIQRISNNERIIIDSDFLSEIKEKQEYQIAKQLTENISEVLKIELPEDEIGYVTMHIVGSKNRGAFLSEKDIVIGNFELVKLAKEMIKIAEAESDCYLEQNEKLLIGLVSHLGPAISRLKMNLDIRNPLLQEIKAFYPHILEISRKCSELAEKRFGIKIPEAEIGYIAMHLGAAIEKKELLGNQFFKAVVACPSGIGTSRMLASRIENEYDNISIVDIISTIDVEEHALLEKDIDLVISTVPIDNCSIPVVAVNPLLLLSDKIKIEKFIKEYDHKAVKKMIKKQNTTDLRSKLLRLSEYSKSIIEIIDNIFIVENCEAASIEELIIAASNEIDTTEEKQIKIAEDLKDREELGNTIVSGKGFVLIHCRTNAVDGIYVGVIKLAKAISCKNFRDEIENISFAIIMLAPRQITKESLEVVGEISKLLVEKSGFIKLLRDGTREGILYELSEHLNHFYKIKSTS